jgi:NAD+ synthase
MNWQLIKDQLISFLRYELNKIGLKKVVVGISGGLDSAVVSILCKEAFGDNFTGVLMPSYNSSVSSLEDAKELCNKFDISYEILDISNMLDVYLKYMNNDRLRIGNYSARLRMSILYDISARDSSIVVGTSNKSELLLGYGTIFGDIACAINPIGQIYKSDEFEFAKFLGVPMSIINKKPSADLWEGQSDEDDLGYSYKKIDGLLKEIIDNNKTKSQILKDGFDEEFYHTIYNRVKSNSFKGKLPIIANIKWYE